MPCRRLAALTTTLTVGLVVVAQSGTPAMRAAAAAVPESRLADTGLFGRDVRVFSPQYPLWSDGLTKRRWVRLPPGTTIDARDAEEWTFPVGTRLWKEFALEGRKVETRMLWKASADGWVPATYVWNAEGTDARLAPPEGVFGVADLGGGRRHNVPATSDCAACHGTRHAPLGFNALQLSTDRDPGALHGEPLPAEAVTLLTLVRERRIVGITDTAPRIPAADPDTRRVLGYLNTNCGICHNGKGEIAALGPVFTPRELLHDTAALVARLESHRSKWQLPGRTSGSRLLVPGAPDDSALFVRMRSRAPSSQMPPLGTVLRDDDALAAVRQWIASP